MSGLASVLIAAYETIKKKPVVARTFWLVALLCSGIACDQAWQDEHRNTQAVIFEKSAEISEKTAEKSAKEDCQLRSRIESAYTRGLEGAGLSQRQTIDAQRVSLTRQQSTVDTCVVSLGKMNPIVREELNVVTVGLFASNGQGRIGVFKEDPHYFTEVFVTTNESETNFHGALKCSTAFTPTSSPATPSNSRTSIVTMYPPVKINDFEWEISEASEGSEWSPSRPIYFTVVSTQKDLGKCNFSRME